MPAVSDVAMLQISGWFIIGRWLSALTSTCIAEYASSYTQTQDACTYVTEPGAQTTQNVEPQLRACVCAKLCTTSMDTDLGREAGPTAA